MRSMRPLYDQILCEEIHGAEQTSPGGIVIPDGSQMRFRRFKVLRVGNGRPILDGKLLPLETKVGDVILARADLIGAKAITVEHEGMLVMLFKEELVIAVEEES